MSTFWIFLGLSRSTSIPSSRSTFSFRIHQFLVHVLSLWVRIFECPHFRMSEFSNVSFHWSLLSHVSPVPICSSASITRTKSCSRNFSMTSSRRCSTSTKTRASRGQRSPTRITVHSSVIRLVDSCRFSMTSLRNLMTSLRNCFLWC